MCGDGLASGEYMTNKGPAGETASRRGRGLSFLIFHVNLISQDKSEPSLSEKTDDAKSFSKHV